jgi:hypothetical protein
MSDPSRAPSTPPERKLHRLHPDDEAELAKQADERVVELDAKQTEAYLRWLETGEGPDPCAAAFSE